MLWQPFFDRMELLFSIFADMSKQSTSFWSFSNELYDKDGVNDACLRLQNGFQFDVNLVLFCFWAAHFERKLSAESWERVLYFSKKWKSQVVQPLRDTRKWMKSEAHHHSDSIEFTELQKRIQMEELAAEKFQQEYIENCIPEFESKLAQFSPIRANRYFEKLMQANSIAPCEEISAHLQLLIRRLKKP